MSTTRHSLKKLLRGTFILALALPVMTITPSGFAMDGPQHGTQPVMQGSQGATAGDQPSTHQDFQDVPASDPFYNFLHGIYTAGIVGGYPCGGPNEPCVGPENLPYYRPSSSVTRAQMSKFVDLARKQPGIHIETSGAVGPIYAQTTAPGGEAIVASAPSGSAVVALSESGVAVDGTSTSHIGVTGHSTSGIGVRGSSTSSTGVFGQSTTGNGVFAISSSGNGVSGQSSTSGIGVRGQSSSGYGVYGQSSSGYAGYFNGSVQVTGNISKGGGSFKIDHPLDPENKYLYHSFVESPDMMNVYNGNVTTNAKGEAVVTMPDWFETLNKDFRYQLTIMGEQFAQARISSKIKNNRFTIMTDKPNVEVSWQVTGIRQDPYANQHRIPVEEAKPDTERGLYLHPDAYGQPADKQIGRMDPADPQQDK